MKISLYLVIFLSACFASFYTGINIGANKMGMHRMAFDASSALNQIERGLADHKDLASLFAHQEDRHHSIISESIRTYGLYLESWSSHIPFRAYMDRTSDFSMAEVINWRLKNQPNLKEEVNASYEKLKEEFIEEGHSEENLVTQQRQFNLVIEKVLGDKKQ